MWLGLNVAVTTVAAAADAAAPPTSSGTKVPTAAVLAPAAAKRGQHTAPFCRRPGVRSVPRATTQRRRTCASRCCRDIVSIRDEKLLIPIQYAVASASVGRRSAAIESSPEERSASGSLRACVSERSEFAGPPLARVPQRGGCAAALMDCTSDRGKAASHEVPDDFGSAATPNTCACDVSQPLDTRSAF